MSGLTAMPFSPSVMLEIIRVWLEHKADVWFIWLLIATVALFVGILLDERAERILPTRYLITNDGSVLEDERRGRLQNGLRTLGFWFAVASIIGEGLFEFLGARAESTVRQFANVRVVIAQQSAATAIAQAGDVASSATELGRLLKDEQRINAKFRKQSTETEARLAMATDELEKATSLSRSVEQRLDLDTRKRRPRNVLIHEARIADDLRLAAFQKQHILVVTCSEPGVEARPEAGIGNENNPFVVEREATSQEVGRQLLGAHWYSAIISLPCANFVGMRFNVERTADSRTTWAADTLAAVLNEALLLEPGALLPIRRAELPATTPFPAYAAYDPRTTVLLFIYNNPFQ